MRPPFPHLFSKVGTDQTKVATSRDNVANCSSEEKTVLQHLEDRKKITVRMRSIDDFRRNNLLDWGEGSVVNTISTFIASL